MAVGPLFIATKLALPLLPSQAPGEPDGGNHPATPMELSAGAAGTATGPAGPLTTDQPSERHSDWEVQVAAMREPARAEVMVRRLAEEGYRAFGLRVEKSRDPWHRVRIGGLRTRSEAQALAHGLIAEGFEGTFVPTP